MRGPALLLLLVLAACSPELEGAPCRTDLNCPTAQTCVEGACRTRCKLDCPEGLACGFNSGAPACECPANPERTFFVDATGGTRALEAPFPTGVREPASCRFVRPSEALEQARLRASDETGAPTEVVSVSGPPHLYSADLYPLEIPAGVTFRSEDGAPAVHVLTFRGNGDMVRLRGGRLEGVTLRNESVGAPNKGIIVTCENGTAALNGVVLEAAEGTTPWVRGVSVEGCRLRATSLVVRGTESAVGVDSSPGTELEGGLLADNDVGLAVQGGAATLRAVEISGSRVAGLRVTGGALVADGLRLHTGGRGAQVLGGTVTLENTTLEGHAGEGLRVEGGSVTGSMILRDNAIGVLVSGGAVNLAAPSEIRGNADAGISLESGGSFTFTGGAEAPLRVTQNGLGLTSKGGAASLSFAEFSENVEEAVVIDEADGIARAHLFSDCTFTSAMEVPLMRVARLGGPDAMGQGLRVERCSFTGGTRSIELGPEPTSASLIGNELSGASGAGLFITRATGSALRIEQNRIFSNGSGGALEGGVVLGGVGGTVPFLENDVFGNARQQIAVSGGSWTLSGPCAAASRVYCYAPEGYGVYADGGSVTVSLYWPRTLPLLGTDYNSGDVSANGCGQVTSAQCP